MNKNKRSDEEIIEAVKNNVSVASVLRQLNLHTRGSGNYRTLYSRIKKLNLDTSHWTGSCTKRPIESYKVYPLKEILVENSTYFSISTLKARLIREKIFEEKCFICGITEWRGQKLVLHLDHINGKYDDHTIENLRLLCPNCHSQTSNYSGKNKKRRKEKYCKCGKVLSKRASACRKCANITRKNNTKTKIQWPEKEVLLSMIKNSNYTQVAKKLGVSDTAIRKRLQR